MEGENIDPNSLLKVFEKIGDAVEFGNRDYNFEKLWRQRDKFGAKPLRIDTKTQTGEDIFMGFREYRETGRRLCLLGLFLNEREKYEPIGYCFAEREGYDQSLLSNTVHESQLDRFRKDKYFKGIAGMVHTGETIRIEHRYRELGLGKKLVETMLDVAEKTKMSGIYFNNISGSLEKLCRSLESQGKIETEWMESSGAMRVRRKSKNTED
jgi:hypothetical protein